MVGTYDCYTGLEVELEVELEPELELELELELEPAVVVAGAFAMKLCDESVRGAV